jgi:3-hydroxyisobutyrate dehydrogenase
VSGATPVPPQSSGAASLGYVGIGLMGLPMTRRLLAAGHRVAVWNRTRAKIVPALEAGATEAADAAELARSADVIFLCVTDAAAAEAAVFGPDGIAAGGSAGKVLVDFSSIDPERTRTFAARLKDGAGMDWVDAPVSGGVPGAEQGTLAIMAGGDAAVVERVRPYVLTMAARFTHMGPIGAGQTTKLCNQVIVGCAMVVIAEAVRLASDAGIAAERLPEALAGGFADSKPLQLFVPRMVAGIHDPPLGHAYTMLKDLDGVRDLARRTGTPVPFASLAAETFRLLAARGGDEVDALAIYKLTAKAPL